MFLRMRGEVDGLILDAQFWMLDAGYSWLVVCGGVD
jgi:hypothetical protein